jgi:hypothetical protein
MGQGDFQDEDVRGPTGFAMRRTITPLRVRELLGLVTDLPPETGDEIERLYQDEPSWLSWALSARGLPPAEAIFE